MKVARQFAGGYEILSRPNPVGTEPKFGYSGVTVRNITETGDTINADFSFEPHTARK